MIRTVILGLALICAGTTAVMAQSATESIKAPEHQPVSSEDRDFLKYAAEDNQAEIALCLLAEKKAGSPAIKAFARLMVDDHVEIESRLAAMANGEKFDLPGGVGQEGEKTRAKLEPLTGRDFENEFMQAQIEDHSSDLKKFAHENASTHNEGLHQYTAETWPILQQHLELAKAVDTAFKGK